MEHALVKADIEIGMIETVVNALDLSIPANDTAVL